MKKLLLILLVGAAMSSSAFAETSYVKSGVFGCGSAIASQMLAGNFNNMMGACASGGLAGGATGGMNSPGAAVAAGAAGGYMYNSTVTSRDNSIMASIMNMERNALTDFKNAYQEMAMSFPAQADTMLGPDRLNVVKIKVYDFLRAQRFYLGVIEKTEADFMAFEKESNLQLDQFKAEHLNIRNQGERLIVTLQNVLRSNTGIFRDTLMGSTYGNGTPANTGIDPRWLGNVINSFYNPQQQVVERQQQPTGQYGQAVQQRRGNSVQKIDW